MERIEYFGRVMKIVTDLMEVSEQDILGKSREYEVVDARWMVIYLMKERGYTSKQIAPLVNHSIRTVNHALNRFYARAKSVEKYLGNTLETARQMLGNNNKNRQ